MLATDQGIAGVEGARITVRAIDGIGGASAVGTCPLACADVAIITGLAIGFVVAAEDGRAEIVGA
jgi:hypothetical protein